MCAAVTIFGVRLDNADMESQRGRQEGGDDVADAEDLERARKKARQEFDHKKDFVQKEITNVDKYYGSVKKCVEERIWPYVKEIDMNELEADHTLSKQVVQTIQSEGPQLHK